VLLLLLAPSFSFVTKASFEVVQEIEYDVSGSVSSIEITAFIPRNTSCQKAELVYVSSTFKLSSDENGNRIITLTPSESSGRIKIVSRVYVDSLKCAFGEMENFDEVARTLSWVCENIKYDLTYANNTLSFDEILRIKRGTCDEFTVAFLNMLAGFKDKKYVVGYAFDGKKFNAHMWAYVDGRFIDPTWCQIPIDATHVTFLLSNSPKYNMTKINVVGRGAFSIRKFEQHVSVRFLSVEKERLVNASVNKTEVELSSNFCIATKVNVGKCVDRKGNVVIEGERNEYCVAFCKDATFSIPVKVYNERLVKYCPLPVALAFEEENLTISTSREEEISYDFSFIGREIERKTRDVAAIIPRCFLLVVFLLPLLTSIPFCSR
jgi:hypothetical protein